MGTVFAVFNNKGGVGKSTTTYNLAIGLHRFYQQKVLVVDIDPQGNSSAALGLEIYELKRQIRDVLKREATITEVIETTASGVDVAPSNILLGEDEIPISGLPGRELLLRKAINPIRNHYDVILIDCPPNVGVFSINALLASDAVLVPVDMSYLGLIGIRSIERTLALVRSALEHPIKIAGVLATRYDNRNNLSREVLETLRQHFGGCLCRSIIPETVKIREAPSHARSIFDHDPGGKGAVAYKELVDEVYGWVTSPLQIVENQ